MLPFVGKGWAITLSGDPLTFSVGSQLFPGSRSPTQRVVLYFETAATLTVINFSLIPKCKSFFLFPKVVLGLNYVNNRKGSPDGWLDKPAVVLSALWRPVILSSWAVAHFSAGDRQPDESSPLLGSRVYSVHRPRHR